MHCPQCGFYNRQNAHYCNRCGRYLPYSEASASRPAKIPQFIWIGLTVIGVLTLGLLIYAPRLTHRRSPVILTTSTASGTISVQPAPARIIDSSTEADAEGDVRDEKGIKLKHPLPGIDLVAVKLERVKSGLKITFTASAAFPKSLPQDQSAIWGMTACSKDGKRCVNIDGKVKGSSWQTTVSDLKGNRNVYIDPPTFDGKNLVITVGIEKLPDWMLKPFDWWANAEWKNKWKDRVPELGKDTTTAPFPGQR